MSPAKAFEASPEAKVLTSWSVIGSIIVAAFLAGSWATWMSFQMTFVKDQVAEIRAELRSRPASGSLSQVP